jgi:chaperonin GroEL
MLSRPAGLITTRDGVTVAREISFPDPVEDQGARILRSACVAVNDEVGDGTTTTAILAAGFIQEGIRQIEAGHVPQQIVREMQAAKDQVVQFLRALAIPIQNKSQLVRVANLSSNGDDEIAEAMAEAAMAVGKDGTITIEDGFGVSVSLEFKEGLELNKGVLSESFLRRQPDRTMEQPLVAVLASHLQSVTDVAELLECASQWPHRELLVFALGVEKDALVTMEMNDKEAVVKSCPMECPGFGMQRLDHLRDIAALTGATFVSRETGMDHRRWDPEWFGSLMHAYLYKHKATLVAFEDAQPRMQEHLSALRDAEHRSTSEFDRDRLKERIAKLSGGLALIRVGATTESEMKERRARVEDALAAVRSALKHGVVPGAGTAYALAARVLENAPTTGGKVLQRGLVQPVQTLLRNAQETAPVWMERLHRTWGRGDKHHGWDAKTREIRDLSQPPEVFDPLGVCEAAVQAAVSVAVSVLSSSFVVTRQ